MTKKELLELDKFCAEKVMGWHMILTGCAPRGLELHAAKPMDIEYYGLWTDGDKWATRVHYFHPTTDPAASMLVLIECFKKDRICMLESKETEARFVITTSKFRHRACYDSLPVCICKIAKALFSPHPKNKEGR